MVLALETGFDFDFFRFLSLPGASDLAICKAGDWASGRGVKLNGGDAIEDNGLRVEVEEPKDPGEATMGM